MFQRLEVSCLFVILPNYHKDRFIQKKMHQTVFKNFLEQL